MLHIGISPKKEMLFLSIPTPCHENWDAMLPNEKGAFCNACAKTVMDFTAMTDDEIKQYFLRHHGQKVCGRFDHRQLAAPVPPAVDLHALLASYLPRWKKFLAILVVVFGGFLTGCNPAQPLGKIAMGTPAICIPDTTAPRHIIGDTLEYLPPHLPQKRIAPAMAKPAIPILHLDTSARMKGDSLKPLIGHSY
ncbi:MAG TPA: hypothetical protein VGM41_06430 [Chitinophagaceae bacterium]